MSRRKGLGRGLDALLGSAPSGAEDVRGAPLRELPVDLIDRGRFQPRTRIDEEGIEELAASIRACGVVQPVVVRAAADGRRYELLAGERRWRAAQAAGLATVPAVIREADDREAAAVALIENIQRRDLNPLEEARALSRLVAEFDLSHREVAEAIGRSRAAVSNLLRLLDLEPEVAALVEDGALEMGHARALLGLTGARQREAAATAASRALSVRDTERLVRRLAADGSRDRARREQPGDPDVRRLEGELAERFGAPVAIRCDARGRGRVTIGFGSIEELDGILARLRRG